MGALQFLKISESLLCVFLVLFVLLTLLRISSVRLDTLLLSLGNLSESLGPLLLVLLLILEQRLLWTVSLVVLMWIPMAFSYRILGSLL